VIINGIGFNAGGLDPIGKRGPSQSAGRRKKRHIKNSVMARDLGNRSTKTPSVPLLCLPKRRKRAIAALETIASNLASEAPTPPKPVLDTPPANGGNRQAYLA
jgi:hypothetical protein